MTIAVDIDLGYEFVVKATFDEVFALLSDVPALSALFPKLQTLISLGDGVYRWEMEKVGSSAIHLQTVYASRYVFDRKKGSVVWTPVKGHGNTLMGGSWKVLDHKRHTALALKIHGTLELPLPAAMKVVVLPLVQEEFEALVEKYIDNLIHKWGGEA